MKKSKIRILSVLLTLTMVISFIPTTFAAAAEKFTDVNSSDWFCDDVTYVSDKDYFNGTGADTFSPQASMTRAMFVTVLYRVDGTPAVDADSSFTDVAAGMWYTDAVAWAASNDIVTGIGDGTFAPEQAVTRQQMAAIMARYIAYYTEKNNVTLESAESATAFADASQIASYAAEAVKLCQSYGLINGNPDGTFGPAATSTRAQVAAVIHRLDLLLTSGNSGTPDTPDTPDTPSTTPGSTSGGGSGGSSSGGSSTTSSTLTANTVKDFVDAAQANATYVKATLEETETNPITINDDITIENNSTKLRTLTLDFGNSNVGNVTISSDSASTIDINGTGSLKSLTINAPKATVNNNINVSGSVNIQAVSQNTFNNSKKIEGNIVVTGPGAINDTYKGAEGETSAAVVIATTGKNDIVTIKGNTSVINVTTDNANVTLASTASDISPVVTSSASKVKLAVNTENKVTIAGSVATVTVETNKPVLEISGSVATLNADVASTLTLSGAGEIAEVSAKSTNITVNSNEQSGGTNTCALAIASLNVSDGAEISAPDGVIDTVEASGSVTLNSSVNTVVASAGAKLNIAETATISTVEASGNLTLSGTGSVGSVDVTTSDSATVEVDNNEPSPVRVSQIASIGGGKVETSGTEVVVVTKAAKPSGLKFIDPETAGGTGKITGVSDEMEYKAVGNSVWNKIGENKVLEVAAGTYQVRVAATNGALASEAVTGTINKAVGVSSVSIQGTPYVGQTLTAVVNAEATGTVEYTWEAGGTVISGVTGKTLTLIDDYVGKIIKVTASNYSDKTAYIDTTVEVTADMSALTKLIAKAAEVQVGVFVKDDGTAASAVAEGLIFVTKSSYNALDSAIRTAKQITAPLTTAAVDKHCTDLRTAIDTYVSSKQTGTYNEVSALRSELKALIDSTENIKVSIAEDAVDVTPETKWVLADDNGAFVTAIGSAQVILDDNTSTAVKLSGAITTLNKAIVTYQKAIRQGAALDNSALLAAINAAEINATSVVKSNDGMDVIPSQTWVTEDAWNTYAGDGGAISTAKGVAIKALVQKDNIDGLKTLNEATAKFNETKKAGTKDIVAPVATVTAEEQSDNVYKIKIDSNEDGKYWYQVGSTIDSGWSTESDLTKSDDNTYTGEFSYKYSAVGKVTVYVKVSDTAENSAIAPVTIGTEDETKDTVASIGSAKYDTLEKAIEAATSGQTVKLEKDATGCGIMIKSANAKDFTIDFNKHKYTVNELVGSTGTENQAFHLEKGCNITLKNGEIAVDNSVKSKSAILIQNYCNLVIDNMTLDGRTLRCENKEDYVVSNNDGDVSIKNSVITACDGDIAVDAAIWGTYNGASVTIENSTVTGKLEVAQWSIENGVWHRVEGFEASPDKRPILKIKSGTFTDIADAVLCAVDGAIVKMGANATADVVIPNSANITLDLNGFKLTNVTGDTITVPYGANLKIKDSGNDGTVDNITHSKAAIYNNGTVILDGGRYTRSKENGSSAENNGGNSFYNILNHGSMTVNANVSVIQTGKYSSMIENGYQSYNSGTERTGYVKGTNSEYPSMVINGGNFSGGLNTIKNDDGGKLTINDGIFENVAQHAVLNWNEATINYGTFTSDGVVIRNSYDSDTIDKGMLTITDGVFTSENGVLICKGNATKYGKMTISGGTFDYKAGLLESSDTEIDMTITGGTFSSNPTDYIADGYTVTGDDTSGWTVSKNAEPAPAMLSLEDEQEPAPAGDGDVDKNDDVANSGNEKAVNTGNTVDVVNKDNNDNNDIDSDNQNPDNSDNKENKPDEAGNAAADNPIVSNENQGDGEEDA